MMLYVALAAVPHPAAPYNVLLLIVDDLRHLGSFSAARARAPHIDRLRREAVDFDNAHAQIAVCGPSRASFLTSLRPDTVGSYAAQTFVRDTLPDAVTLPQFFGQHNCTEARPLIAGAHAPSQ
jgi:iduronate 2-sulfatase